VNGLRVTAISLLLLSACGPEKDYPQRAKSEAACNTGVAQIAVYDGVLENLCGCQEPRATGTFTTCTVAAGTAVVFYFPLTKTRHQIISTGADGFPSSPINDPEKEPRANAHAVILLTPGIYRFEDAFHPALSGQIVVF
jgi:hypothetical protein